MGWCIVGLFRVCEGEDFGRWAVGEDKACLLLAYSTLPDHLAVVCLMLFEQC